MSDTQHYATWEDYKYLLREKSLLEDRIGQLEADIKAHENGLLNHHESWLRQGERIEKLENFIPDVLQDFEKRLVKLEDKTSKDYFAALTSAMVLERLEKLEQSVANLAQKKDVVDVEQKYPSCIHGLRTFCQICDTGIRL